MSRYEGIIFDLDGTLLDTLTDLGGSVNEVLADFNFPTHEIESYKQKIGRGFKDLIKRSMPDGTSESIIEEGLKLFLNYYDKNYLKTTIPYPGITNLLESLNNKIIMAVNSNKRDDYTKNLISIHFPNISFIECIGERSGFPKKPDPTSGLQIIEKMNLDLSKIVYIGDSNTDMKTAINLGIDSIGCIWGFREKDELISCGATYIASKPSDILKIVI